MKIIAFFLQHSRKAVLLSIVAGVFSGACNAALLAVINTALKGNRHAAALLWAFGGLCLLLPLARFTSELLLTKLGQEATYRLRMQLCQHVLSAPLRHLERLGAARLLTTLIEDIPSITGALGVLPLLCVNTALVAGCLVYMAKLSWLLFGLVTGFMIFGVASYQIPVLKVRKIFRKARQDVDALTGHLRGLTHGTKELKIHRGRRQAFITEQMQETARSLMRNNISALRMYAGAASWGQCLVFIVIGFYLFFLPNMRDVNSATLTGYTLALLYLMAPLQVIMNSLPQLSRANIALQTVTDLGFALTSDKPEDLTEAAVPVNELQKLELKALTHTYKRENECEDFAIGPVDLVIERGELLFITGGNGSGKTTLVKLITGLYMPETGHIHLNGRLIDEHNVEWYRQHFSVVFSDFYLFEHLLGLSKHDTEIQAQHYLEELKLSQKVKVANGKLSTTELSQGQRKRLALLTAYLEDRPVYVFDEWAADQDPYFKNIFYMHLLPELKARGKTVIVISHDDRYFDVADRIIKLSDGQIISDPANPAAGFQMAASRPAS